MLSLHAIHINISSIVLHFFKHDDLGPLNRIHNPLTDSYPEWKNTALNYPNASPSYRFSETLQEYRIEAKKVGSALIHPDLEQITYTLRITLLIYNLRMIRVPDLIRL